MPTVEFIPTRDCWIQLANPDTAHESLVLEVEAQSGKTTTRERTLMLFDISSIPTDYVSIDSVTLRLEIITSSVGTDNIAICRINNSFWTEAATWNKRDGVTAWTAGGEFEPTSPAPYVTTISGTPGAQTIASGANFIALVEDAIDNLSGQLHLMIKVNDEPSTTSYARQFSSEEETSPAGAEPTLIIAYTAAGVTRRRTGQAV